jgi:predicted ATPase
MKRCGSFSQGGVPALIRNCRIIAVEGTHGSGKTTLVHGVVARLKAKSVAAAGCIDSARLNPFIEAARIHGRAEIDVFAELSLFGELLSEDARLARFNDVLVMDKSVANILGYARHFLGDTPFEERVLQGMAALAGAYAEVYDRVFFLNDYYNLDSTEDRFRPKEQSFQRSAAEGIRRACLEMGLTPIDIPPGLSREDKEGFVLGHMV